MNTLADRQQTIGQYAEKLLAPPYTLENMGIIDSPPRDAARTDDTLVVCYPKRSGTGRSGGSLAEISVAELGTAVVSAMLETAAKDVPTIREHVGAVVFGQVVSAGSGMNPARQIGIESGIDLATPAWMVRNECGSGATALIAAARAIKCGEYDLIVAGGVENMSQVPYYLENDRKKSGLGNKTLVDGVLAALTDPFSKRIMGETAEEMAIEDGLSREQLDRYSVRSQHLAELAVNADWFTQSIVPITINHGKDIFATDEYVRGSQVTEATLASMKPQYSKNGVLTPGNSSGINDGASAMIMTTVRRARELGLEESMDLISYGEAGVDPSRMGRGPVPASRIALGRAGLTMADMSVVLINEAFANIPLADACDLNVLPERLNPFGGAIAFGHPIGSTGARLVVELADYYRNNPDSGDHSLSALCIGAGQGVATIWRRVRT
ncbi:MAG: thiolase family protein [Candidatus Saccharibacteria bacterium]